MPHYPIRILATAHELTAALKGPAAASTIDALRAKLETELEEAANDPDRYAGQIESARGQITGLDDVEIDPQPLLSIADDAVWVALASDSALLRTPHRARLAEPHGTEGVISTTKWRWGRKNYILLWITE